MKNNVLKNTIMLYGLTAAKLIFPLLTLPYLTRVLSVDTYGTVTYVKSIMQYFQLFVDFGFMLSGTKDIVQAANDKGKLRETVSEIFFARLILGGISLVLILLLIIALPILRENAFYTLLSFGSVFCSIFLFDYLFRGLEKMQIITIRYVVMRGISTVLTFVLVHGNGDMLWIPVLDIIGSLAAAVWVTCERRMLGIRLCLPSISRAMKKLRESAVYFASNLATTVFGALTTVLIGIFMSTTDVAYWSVSMQLVSAVQIMYNPIVDGVYPEMVRSRDIRYIRKMLLIFMPVVVVGCAFCVFAAEYILRIVCGPQYIAAGDVFRMLVPVLLFSFPAMLIGWPVLGSIEKQREVTKTTVIAAVMQIVSFVLLLAGDCFTLMTAAAARSVTEFVLLATRVYYFRKYRGLFQRG